MDVSSHTLMLPAGADVPKWLHLIPAGTFKGDDGRGPYHLRDPQKVITASMAAGRLPIDENHSTMMAAKAGAPAPARGWIVAMEMRADGIWGQIEWTPTGTAIMTDKSYKGVSPVFDHEKDGTVVRIRNAALTNLPNLTMLTTMHTSNPEDQMDKKAIRTALGLAETVEDAEVLTAAQTASNAVTALQTAEANVTRLQGELEAVKRTHAPVETVTALQTRLDTLQADRAREKAVAFVDGAIAAGKPLTSARDIYISQHVANAEQTEKLVNLMPSINSLGGSGKSRTAINDAGDGDGDALSDEDVAICTKMGLDRKAFVENRKKMAAAKAGGV